MLTMGDYNAASLRNSSWEEWLQRARDPHLFIRFNPLIGKWCVIEYYPENIYPNVLVILQDENGNDKPFGQWVLNRLDVMHLNWKHKQDVGTNKWFDELENEAESQRQKILEKDKEERLYKYKNDYLQWRKGVREEMGTVGGDVFAGYQYGTADKLYRRDNDSKRETVNQSDDVSKTNGESVQSDTGNVQNAS